MRTPGNVVPITSERQDEDQECDDQQSGGFKRIDLWRVMVFGGGLLGLPFWCGGGHEHIVAPEASRGLNFRMADQQSNIGYSRF